MHIFTFLNCCTCVIGSVHDLVSELFFHSLLASLTRVLLQPSEAESLTTIGANLDRYLICSTTNTSCLYFKYRHYIVHSTLEYLQCRLACLLFYLCECTIYDLLGCALLAIKHDGINELCYNLIVVYRIRQNISFLNMSFTWHVSSLLNDNLIIGTHMCPLIRMCSCGIAFAADILRYRKKKNPNTFRYLISSVCGPGCRQAVLMDYLFGSLRSLGAVF